MPDTQEEHRSTATLEQRFAALVVRLEAQSRLLSEYRTKYRQKSAMLNEAREQLARLDASYCLVFNPSPGVDEDGETDDMHEWEMRAATLFALAALYEERVTPSMGRTLGTLRIVLPENVYKAANRPWEGASSPLTRVEFWTHNMRGDYTVAPHGEE